MMRIYLMATANIECDITLKKVHARVDLCIRTAANTIKRHVNVLIALTHPEFALIQNLTNILGHFIHFCPPHFPLTGKPDY